MRRIRVNGKEYVLRYDMEVNDWLEEEYGNLREAVGKMNSSKDARVATKAIFLHMANSANEYLAEIGKAERQPEIRDEDLKLFTKHSSPGWLKTVIGYVMGAIADGNVMKSNDDGDNDITDGYLKEIEELEKIKN